MPFQFECPQGHLLEGEPEQAGQTINCPVCGMLFIIPAPIAAPVEAKPAPPPEPAEPDVLHIPCPQGHELEVPLDMLDTEVLCPTCNTQFMLRAKDSVEHRQRREEAQRIKDEKTNTFWFKFSIWVASGVVLLLLTLMIMSAMSQSDPEESKPTKKKKAKSKPEVVSPDDAPVEDESNPK
jgi:DNA-directed RNA polymerase subunit RPC12/RpoP